MIVLVSLIVLLRGLSCSHDFSHGALPVEVIILIIIIIIINYYY